MKLFRVLLLTTAVAIAGPSAAQETTSLTADEQSQALDARYSEAERLRRAIGVDLDIKQAFEIHSELADEGYGRSLHRIGDFYYSGIVVGRDYRRAADYYGQAVEAGVATSLVQQSKALRRANAGEAALEVIEQAVSQNLDRGLEERATGHLFREYGSLSDAAFGFSEAKRLSEEGNNQVATFLLAEAYRRGLGTQINHDEAFKLYEALTLEGHPAGTERLAEYYAIGRVVEKDADRAIELYRVAAGLGREGAYVPMSELLIELGRGSDALLAAQQGADDGSETAKLNLALGHLDGSFGTDSDREFGRTELNSMAEGGNLRAAAYVLDRLGDGDDLSPNLDLVLANLDGAMRNGDGRAAESLLRFYREKPLAVADSRQRRQDILDNFAGIIRERIYYPELANFAYDTNRSAEVFPLLLEIVEEADGDGYERALLQVFRRNANAFTYILQNEFRERGQYNGRLTGRMNEATLEATLRYCQEKGIFDECKHGPLRTPSVRLMATALRRDRDLEAQSDG